MVLKWLPVSHNKELGEELPGVGDSPIKTGEGSRGVAGGGTWTGEGSRGASGVGT